MGPQAAGGQRRHRGRDQNFSKKDCATAAREVGATYRKEMHRLAESGNLDVWYSRVDIEEVISGLADPGSQAGQQGEGQA